MLLWPHRLMLATGTAVAASVVAVAPSAARATAGELTITGPPGHAVVAISDPRFIAGARVRPASRAPALTALRLLVSGTSTCGGSVTVNGLKATSSAGGWTARIPVTALTGAALGHATLTDRASVCQITNGTFQFLARSLRFAPPSVNGGSLARN